MSVEIKPVHRPNAQRIERRYRHEHDEDAAQPSVPSQNAEQTAVNAEQNADRTAAFEWSFAHHPIISQPATGGKAAGPRDLAGRRPVPYHAGSRPRRSD